MAGWMNVRMDGWMNEWKEKRTTNESEYKTSIYINAARGSFIATSLFKAC